MKYDTIVLAGSPNQGALKACSNATTEALIKIGNKFMVEYVVDALQSTKVINRIVVAGAKQQLSKVFGSKVIVLDGGATVIDTLLAGIKFLDSKEPVLVVCADIPLLTNMAVEDFINRCLASRADFYYPIIEQQVVERRFPDAKRTYVHLTEGVFTGGNLMLINPGIAEKCAAFARLVVELRKKPVKLCQLFGVRLLLKFILRRLSIVDIEQRINELLNISSTSIISEFPEIGVDVDKPVDLELVLANLDETA